MEKDGGGDGVKTMFTDEEVSKIREFKRVGDDHVEVRCGCTSFRYGDAGGILRVFPDGHLQVKCQCTPACDERMFFSQLLPTTTFLINNILFNVTPTFFIFYL